MSRGKKNLCIVLLLILAPIGGASRAQVSTPKYEFRGAWIATVLHLDWPNSSFSSSEQQKSELAAMINGLADRGINAIFFQIRSESDAMYQSSIEPWSRHLTGQQGRAPNPLYDPLAEAIRLAHARGVELHAWINPFRVERSVGGSTLAANHVSNTHPEWLLQVNVHSILNPGIPDARAYIVDVIRDVAMRYDIDGVHFDDFFYPYPPNEIGTQDLATFLAYGGDFSNMADWRRNNINQFVRATSEALNGINPDLKFGISPFGIWRSGVPAGISGLSSVDVIFSDPVKWLSEKWVDYVAPQLYWPFGGSQDFGSLANWWSGVANGRNIYPGLAVYRSDISTASGDLYTSSEIPSQIRYIRDHTDSQGTIMFRASNISRLSSRGLADSLSTDLYRFQALTPVMNWHDTFPPDPPENLTADISSDGRVALTWDPALTGFTLARRFAIYRIASSTEPDARTVTNNPENLIATTYSPSYIDRAPGASVPTYYYVTAVSANSVEGDETAPVVLTHTGRDNQPVLDLPFEIQSVSPNPFRNDARIRFETRRAAVLTIRIYDILGRVVDELHPVGLSVPGEHVVEWKPSDMLGSGTYFIVVSDGQKTISHPVTRLR